MRLEFFFQYRFSMGFRLELRAGSYVIFMFLHLILHPTVILTKISCLTTLQAEFEDAESNENAETEREINFPIEFQTRLVTLEIFSGTF